MLIVWLAALACVGSWAADINRDANIVEMLLVTSLRAHRRAINGIVGEEALERIRETNLANTYGFNWESRGVAGDLLQPFLSLELQAGVNERTGGKPVNASLHQDALLKLWDSIASSIRLRKSNPVRPHAPHPATPN
jgi:hypothetical protein